MAGAIDGDDLQAIARMAGLSPATLQAELEKCNRELGYRSFLRVDRRTRDLTLHPPLPEQLRAQTARVVQRRTVA